MPALAKAATSFVAFSMWTASTSITPTAAQSAEREASPVVMTAKVDIKVELDGRYSRTSHIEMTASNDAAARQIAQVPIPYRESLDVVDIKEAFTLRPDGTKISVQASGIFDQALGGTGLATFNDIRQKIVVFPRVQAGDKVVIDAIVHTNKPVFPGEFYLSSVFFENMNEAVTTIAVPKEWALNIETSKLEFRKQTTNSQTIYTWRYVPPTVREEEPSIAIDHPERTSHFIASTFKSYEEFGRAYAKAITDKAAVTPKIQKLADEITAGENDRRVQAQKIYEWVSRHTRYVNIALGLGSVIPHDAQTVLYNGYGDCKDHAVLVKALLAAKDIVGEIALINLGYGYQLSKTPALTELNHAITWLPEFNLYADSTSGLAPFGVLSFEEYGKPTVIAVAKGDVLHKTPVLAPGLASVVLRTKSQFDPGGHLIGETSIDAAGPFSIVLRSQGANIETTGPKEAARSYFSNTEFGGSGTFEAPPSNVLSDRYNIRGQFALQYADDILQGTGFFIHPGYRLLAPTGDVLLGSLDSDVSEDEPTPCFSGTQTEEFSLYPPEGYIIGKLPEDTAINEKEFTFKSHWSKAGRQVTVRRDFEVRVTEPLCTGDLRKRAVRALESIEKDRNRKLVLESDPAESNANYAAEFDEAIRQESTNAAAFLNRAEAHKVKEAYDLGIADADRAISLKPDYVEAYVTRGMLSGYKSSYKRAAADFDKAISLDPKDPRGYTARAALRLSMRELEGGKKDIETAKKLGANDKLFESTYALFQASSGKSDEAIARIEKANEGKPKDAAALEATAMIKAQAGKEAEALADADAALALDSGSRIALSIRANILITQKQYAVAVETLKNVNGSSHDDVDLYVTRGMAKDALKKYADAIKDYDKALAIAPDRDDVAQLKREAQDMMAKRK